MPSPLQALSAKDRSTGASSISASDRRLVVTFYAASAVTAKDAVCFATGKTGADRVVYVEKTDSDAPQTHQGIGYALDTVAAGERVRVVVKGYVEGAAVASAVTIGELINAGADPGRGVKYVSGDNETPFAQALENASGNTCDVWVIGVFA
tara:strand:+ start:16 stop:468 length:453 start_codon:yes stop_codon:yes gene_type:complete